MFLGLAERSTLHHVLCLGRAAGAFSSPAASPGGGPGIVPYEEMLRYHYPAMFPGVDEIKAALTEEDYQKVINLRPYCNPNCFTVLEHTSASRCYTLFREMGLRHLPVLSQTNEASGIITRQNLVWAQEQGHGGDEAMLPQKDKGGGSPGGANDAEEDGVA